MSHCWYHPAAPLTQTIQHFPTSQTGLDDVRERTMLRCSVVIDEQTGRLCPFVMVEADLGRIDKRICRICGGRIRDNYSLTDNRCNKCKAQKDRERNGHKSS